NACNVVQWRLAGLAATTQRGNGECRLPGLTPPGTSTALTGLRKTPAPATPPSDRPPARKWRRQRAPLCFCRPGRAERAAPPSQCAVKPPHSTAASSSLLQVFLAGGIATNVERHPPSLHERAKATERRLAAFTR